MKYIHEHSNWPDLYWDNEKLAVQLALVRHQQGFLLGRMSAFGFELRTEANLEVLTTDVIKSSEIEGERLQEEQVRSSIARNLGIDLGGLPPANRHVDGVVEMMLDATQRYEQALSEERLFAWHSALFPSTYSVLRKITVGTWRTPQAGPMQVVSGPMGRERIHFEAPAAERLEYEMRVFLDWFNHAEKIDPFLKAGVAHFWFVTIHPFDDGNGRIARALADMCLARADGIPERFYSMSSSILRARKSYYDVLETTQKGDLDITPWLEWFLDCLSQSIENADEILNTVLYKAHVWEKLKNHAINERQRKVINDLLGNFRGNLTTSK
ncbi:MAG: Fic family protein, partial [Gammaproteobacteria bacterium]|nr:Fic family protein [Gammaproteobacteria bacterium]